jgi:hypothetical protein
MDKLTFLEKFKIEKLKEVNKIHKKRLEKIWRQDPSKLNSKLIKNSLPRCPPSNRVKKMMEKNEHILKENLVSF